MTIPAPAIDRMRFARAPGGRWFHAFRDGSREPICGYKLTGGNRGQWDAPRPAGDFSVFTMSETHQAAWDRYVCPNCRAAENRRVQSDRELQEARNG